MEKPKHPGGRPKLADHEKLIQRSVRLTSAQWAKIDAYGWEWLRKLIASGKPPKPD